MGGKILTVLIFVVVLGGIVFFFTSGAPGGISDFVKGFSLSSTSTPRLSSERVPRTGSTSIYPGQTGVKTSVPTEEEIKPAIDPRLIPSGFTAEDLSIYFREVRMSFTSSRTALKASFKGTGTINISGWVMQGRRGSFIIPRAVNIYEPSGLAAESDIQLESGGYLNIYYGQSAIGLNLRLNKCTGYLQARNKFVPSLPLSCPNPVNDFDMSRVMGACEDYIDSLRSCKLPSSNPPVPETDYVCPDYLDEINLSGCYSRHRFDSDFLSHEFRAWTRNTFLDPDHDRVLLFDKAGKLVDVYEY
ncbi:MAG: hypothetical protein AAB897_01815 [Patescibacteria group bacterium]